MPEIYNKLTKRFNTVKRALKNNILTNPNNFEIPKNYVLVKTKRGHELKTKKQAIKYIDEAGDILPVNKKIIYNPKTKKLVAKTAKNIKTVKKVRKDMKAERINNYSEKFILDKITAFTSWRYMVNVNNEKEFYQNIMKRIDEVDNVTSVTIHFRSKITGEYVFRTINGNYLLSYEDFMGRLAEIRAGTNIGSDVIEDDEYDMMLDRYDILVVKITGSGESDKIVYECERCDGDEDGACYEKVLKKLGFDNIDKKMEYYDKFLEKVESCVNNGDRVAIVANQFNIDKSPMKLAQNRDVIKYDYSVTVGGFKKTEKLRLIKLEQRDIKPYYLFNPTMNPTKFVIYDGKNQHYDYCESLELKDNVYVDMRRRIFMKFENEYILTQTPSVIEKQIGTAKKNMFYLFFDYETVVDYTKANTVQEYSVSIFVVKPEDMGLISHLDKNNKRKELIEKVACSTYNFVGYDCSKYLIEFIRKSQIEMVYAGEKYENVFFRLCSFNGANFDNIILLRSYLKYGKDINVENIFYNGNQLLNFVIDGRHDTFDLAKHLTGSLASLSSSFKVNCLGKTSFDHYKAQQLHDEGKLIEYMTDNDELIDYNNRDVYALAIIMHRYKKSLKEDPLTKRFGGDLTAMKTIGSVIWKLAKNYWKNLVVSHSTKKKIVKKEPIIKNGKTLKKQRRVVEFINEIVQKPIHFPDLDYTLYKDILKYKCAGRVELFNGIQEIEEMMVSLDICSMYPYVMAVMDGAYYPYGELNETDSFKDDHIGFYYCDIDQSCLKGKNLPNIYPEKVYETKKDGSQGNLTENDWQSSKVLKDYCISSVMIKQLRKYGCSVTIKKGYYFSDKIRGCDLFKFILTFMQKKNEQDGLKASDSELYNSALRETLKLLMNSLSGKVIEGLHCEKTEVVDVYKYLQKMKDPKIDDVSCINIIGDKVFVSANYKEECLINKQRPIFLGVMIYDYAKCYIYDTVYSVIGLDRIIYTDTDACKFRKSELDRPEVRKFYEETQVPFWGDVLEYDKRYNNFKMYNPNDKVFGSYENELNDIDYFACYQKKSWIGLNKEKYMECVDKKDFVTIDKYYKMSFKGVQRKSIILTGDECFIDKNMKLRDGFAKNAIDHANTNEHMMVKNNLYNFSKQLLEKKYCYVLTTQLRRVIKNSNRKVSKDDTHKFNKNNNTIQCCPIIKKITIV